LAVAKDFQSTEETREYQPETRTHSRSERGPLALVVGGSSLASEELYDLLLRRLRICCLISTIGLLLFLGFTIFYAWDAIKTGRIQEPQVFAGISRATILRGFPTLVSGIIALLLFFFPPSTVRGLRIVEVILIGACAATMLAGDILGYNWLFHQSLGDSAELLQFKAGSYLSGTVIFWVILITWYGTLIPNTWLRASIAIGFLATCPILLQILQTLWLLPLPATIDLRGQLFMFSLFVGTAAAIAIFSSSRIEILRQKATAARRLGQYILGDPLGAGGMGEVYSAEHVLLRRPVAIKVIRPARNNDPKLLRRFEREVQVTATLTHPNTIQIFDYGHAVDGTFYYVMEYLPGLTLEEVVHQEGPLPFNRTIHFLRQLCGALKEAHRCGLIHRDIKPGNVMICERGGVTDVVKLLDFGLVLPLGTDDDGEKLTLDGTVTGTPAYISPEQAGRQQPVDARSDIYSLGALAYFLLTGKSPFAGRSGIEMIVAHLSEEPKRPIISRPDIPAELEAVVLRCLAKNPEQRFHDVASLDLALAACQINP
jgi:hypothetical protein